MMEYKGYLGTAEYDAEAKLFHGNVINTKDVITFQGTATTDIEKAFKESVDDYLTWCKEEGVEPQKPHSEKFTLHLPPELHREVAIKASKLNISVDSFVERAIINEIATAR
jgi:predicted HicB family RNase H-like nuclease